MTTPDETPLTTQLDRVLAAADEREAVLQLDEADALTGARTQVQDAHDRYGTLDDPPA